MNVVWVCLFYKCAVCGKNIMKYAYIICKAGERETKIRYRFVRFA